jgi:hypothetical protein
MVAFLQSVSFPPLLVFLEDHVSTPFMIPSHPITISSLPR